MTAIDVTPVLTGKESLLDQWLPLQGGHNSHNNSNNSNTAAIRIVCEYEPSDAALQPGDRVVFTSTVAPADLYPFYPGRVYVVDQVVDDAQVILSWTTSPEGWVSTVSVHRYMLQRVAPRNNSANNNSVVDKCHSELASLKERLEHSPLVHACHETVQRVPEEGLVPVGEQVLHNGLSLLHRWWEGGVATTAQDVTFATNWDGRHNPQLAAATTMELEDMMMMDPDEATASSGSSSNTPAIAAASSATTSAPLSDASRLRLDNMDNDDSTAAPPPLPNMPPCPITGEPMRDPVVAADGHTYERSAIARWLLQSDKSPLTGSVLSHKDLVPNYMLLSSLQDSSSSSSTAAKQEESEPNGTTAAAAAAVMEAEEIAAEDEEVEEVNID